MALEMAVKWRGKYFEKGRNRVLSPKKADDHIIRFWLKLQEVSWQNTIKKVRRNFKPKEI